MPFSSAHASLRNALNARGYAAPTPVQAAILAPEVDVRDVLVSAQTGSGKTVAFGIALAKTLLGDAPRFTASGAPRALIVTPTRELAMQVHRELTWLYADTGARITTCVGGMDPRREGQALHHGVHIVVGTPGRLCDHLARGSLVLDRLAAVVLDEADEMLDMGFREDLERLLDAAPKERRTLLFSATIPPQIATMAKRYQRDALRIATSGVNDRHGDIEYQVVSIVPRERDLAVVNLLRFHDPPGALVFCGTRDGVTHLAANLSERGFSVAALSGELSQRERNQALQALRDGRARVCVATDVAARGLDLPDLGLVIHADLPQNKEILVHRSGRTGRAGKKGLAIVVAVDAARRFVERLLHSARIEAKWHLPPSSDDIRERDQQHLAGEIQALTEDISDADREVARTLLTQQSADDLVAALVRLRREARPAPEELTIPASMRPRGDRMPPGHDRMPPGRDRGERPRYDHAVRVPTYRGHDDRPQRPERDARPQRDGFPARPDHAANRAAHVPAARTERTVPAPANRTEHQPAVARTADRAEPKTADRTEHAPASEGSTPVAQHAASGAPAAHEPAHSVEHAAPVAPAAPRAHAEADAHGHDAEHAAPATHERGAEQPSVVAHSAPHADADAHDHAGAAEHAEPREHDAEQPSAGERAERAAGRAAGRAAHARAELARAAERAAAGESGPATDAGAPPSAERTPRTKRTPHIEHASRAARDAGERERAEHETRTGRRLVWFTINIGRSKNADPKWLIPLLCRRGGISKNEIGKIQIFARETRVEISHDVSEQFAAAVREPDAKDRNIHIEPVDEIAI